jgi:hypothetical protein
MHPLRIALCSHTLTSADVDGVFTTEAIALTAVQSITASAGGCMMHLLLNAMFFVLHVCCR